MRIALLVCCLSCYSIVAPDAVYTDVVNAEFAIAQVKVSAEYNPRARLVSVDDFSWHDHDGPMMCGGVWANGCFGTRPPRIEFNSRTPSVIRHESGHAILWKIGDDRWKCFEHGC